MNLKFSILPQTKRGRIVAIAGILLIALAVVFLGAL